MNVEEFLERIDEPAPADEPVLEALRFARRGDWEAAHRIVQDIDDANAAWVHAHLHRQEGDLGNARYWYRRAGHAEAGGSLDEEWREIVAALLAG